MSSSADFRSGYIAITGLANAGKSTLLNNILGTKVSIVSDKAQTTRNNILGIKTLSDAQLIFVDTPGLITKKTTGKLGSFLMNNLREGARDADVNMLVVDAQRAVRNFSEVDLLSKKFKEKFIASPQIIALNKVDLVPDRKALLPIMKKMEILFTDEKREHAPIIVPISAKKSDGLELLETELVKTLPNGPAYFPEDMKTDQRPEFMLSEIIREKLYQYLNNELPYCIAVKIEQLEEQDNLLHISAVIMVERDSQKAIVIGRKGERLSKIGKNARLELEQLLGKRIFLKTFVRVEHGWTRSERGLQRVGYGAN